MFKENKICVSKDRKQILCFVRDEFGEISYETMYNFNIETIMKGDIAILSSERDVEMFTKYLDENTIDLITYKEMLEHLLKLEDKKI